MVFGLVWDQLRFRRGRLVATLLAVSISVASFSLLTSAARGAQLQSVGTVRANFRPVYDLLVRPAGSASKIERSDGLVQSGQAASMNGGISTAQWQSILKLPGVSVAAPVAVGGYVMQTAVLSVDLSRYLEPGVEQQVLRVLPTWTSDRGLTRVTDGSHYLYATSDALLTDPGNRLDLLQQRPGGSTDPVCESNSQTEGVDPLEPADRRDVSCWSSNSASASGMPAAPRVRVLYAVPMLLAAIDPVQEAKLDGLDSALVSGRYLDAGDGVAKKGRVPVLAASGSDLDEQLQLQVQRLGGPVADEVASGATLNNALADFDAQPGTPLGRLTVTPQQEYPRLLADLGPDAPQSDPYLWAGPPQVQSYWTVGAPTLTGDPGGGLTEAAQPSGTTDWGPSARDDQDLNPLPLELGDTGVSPVAMHGDESTQQPQPYAALSGVGVFDPSKVDLGPALASVPMDLFSQPGAQGADAASQKALGGRELLPSANIAGPIAQRPQLLTTLSGLAQLRRAPYTSLSKEFGVDTAAPISTVRVRVAGAVGMDALSRRRVQAVADEIHQATGLQVDFMEGSSPTSVAVAVPAGRFGRPGLTLSESWVKKGVAAVIVSAVDRKTLLLAGLVLVACVLAVGNATSAEVRTRGTELGVLACLGWSRWRLFELVFAESAGMGLAAGVLGSVLAWGCAPLLGIHLRLGYALEALPAALVLTLLAASVPAWRATRADPGAAVRPSVNSVRRGRVPRRVSGLAVGNLLRSPGRTALGALSLAVGVGALTLLVVISSAFRGTVTGTVLGDAVTVQVRGTDYVAAVITVLLGAVSVADVLYVDIRERAGEFALLGATGWADGPLSRLAGYEALAMGLLGSLLGVASAIGLTLWLRVALPPLVYPAAAAAVLAGAVVAVVAAIIPVRSLRRLPMARLLAEE